MEAKRATVLDYYGRLEAALRRDEKKLHDAVKLVNRRAIVKNKKALLFKQMCLDAGIKDDKLAAHLLSGIRLTGTASKTGEFPEKQRIPALSEEQGMQASKWTRQAVKGKGGPSGDKDLDDKVWAKWEIFGSASSAASCRPPLLPRAPPDVERRRHHRHAGANAAGLVR